VSVYRVHVTPRPGTEDAKRTKRLEGYFYCLGGQPNPELLLAEQTADCEIILMVFDEIGRADRILGTAHTRARFAERGGCLFKLGNTVHFESQ